MPCMVINNANSCLQEFLLEVYIEHHIDIGNVRKGLNLLFSKVATSAF